MKVTKYDANKIEEIKQKINNMPIIEKQQQDQLFNKQEAIKMLAKEIEYVQKRGYTISQITELLNKEGVSITELSLKVYLRKSKKSNTSLSSAVKKRYKAKPINKQENNLQMSN